MKTLKVKASTPSMQGRFGKYLRLSNNEGVKIYKGQGRATVNLLSKTSQRIIKEATIGVLAGSPTKGLAIVSYKGKKYLGIVQRHISLKSQPLTSKDLKKAKSQLRKAEVIHSDLHKGNLIKKTTGLVILDFDPEYAFFIGRKQTYYATKNRLIKALKGK